MKLRAIKEASTLSRYPFTQEVYRRILKRGYHNNVTPEDISRFAAWLEVEIQGLGRQDLKRLLWDGVKGLKDDPAGVENVFKEFVQTWTDDPALTDEEIDDAHDDALDEISDDFHTFMSGKRHR